MSLIPNVHPNQKQTGDGGVDGSGQILVRDPDGNTKYETVVVSVKGGKNLHPSMVGELAGTMEGKAAFGISASKPSRGMYEAAAKAGVYHTEYGTYPKVQIYTVGEYFAGVCPKAMSTVDTTRVAMQKREPRHAQATL